MESAEQRLLRDLRIGEREYMCGMMTWDAWLGWQRAVAAEAHELNVADKLAKLLMQDN